MKVRLYLHGNGKARGTHMSIFFILMRTKFDEFLKFPFNYKVAFHLYDQSSEQEHFNDSFRPDIKSSSFQRPNSEMNIASGIPMFFPLTKIQEKENSYIREDTMFIKVMVDFVGIPKRLLTAVLCLNPGLPTNVQQAVIELATERWNQQEF
jgi:TNF receptor-associated factor 2